MSAAPGGARRARQQAAATLYSPAAFTRRGVGFLSAFLLCISVATIRADNTTLAPAVTGAPSTTAEPSTTTVAPNTTAQPSTTTAAPNTTPAPTTSTAVPNTTVEPSTTTVVPSTTTAPNTTAQPSTTTAEPATTTAPNTTAQPSTTTTETSTTTAEPTTTTTAPNTTTEPSTTTTEPSTTTAEPSTSTAVPTTTTTAPNTTAEPSTTSAEPSTTTAVPTTSTTAPNTTAQPSTTTVSPTTTTTAPNTTAQPSTTTVAPISTTAPTTSTVAPSTTSAPSTVAPPPPPVTFPPLPTSGSNDTTVTATFSCMLDTDITVETFLANLAAFVNVSNESILVLSVEVVNASSSSPSPALGGSFSLIMRIVSSSQSAHHRLRRHRAVLSTVERTFVNFTFEGASAPAALAKLVGATGAELVGLGASDFSVAYDVVPVTPTPTTPVASTTALPQQDGSSGLTNEELILAIVLPVVGAMVVAAIVVYCMKHRQGSHGGVLQGTSFFGQRSEEIKFDDYMAIIDGPAAPMMNLEDRM